MRGKELLTSEQRKELLRLSFTTENELAMYYTLSESDIEIINRHRRSHNRLGFAVQLCVLRNPGCSLVDLPEIPESLLQFVAKQIEVDPDIFSLYARRDPTRREHLEEIRQEYELFRITGLQKMPDNKAVSHLPAL